MKLKKNHFERQVFCVVLASGACSDLPDIASLVLELQCVLPGPMKTFLLLSASFFIGYNIIHIYHASKCCLT